ncbi:MAG: sigma-54-dependent Fis family transcriptional regulator [Gemmatimonadetes bacterium]|nr:sigma-54-dependent Fis family transcriptional regulator [Gemmatimonadota bacterium]
MSYHLASTDRPQAVAATEPSPAEFAFRSIVGQSRPLRDAIELAHKVAARRMTTVLLVGETGTGKELFARGIHYAGPTPGEPFVAVNCAAIPESLLESELFGHERGAFTDARGRKRGLLELAGAGTLFLDEVGELPPNLQPKLLRVLEERRVRRLGGVEEIEIGCRVIAGTNEPLEDAVADGRFRDDLFYRLNVFRLVLPPLRAREGDMEILAQHFLTQVAQEQGIEPKRIAPEAMAILRAHPWPGNVRELKNVIERAAILSEGDEIREEHIRVQDRRPLPPHVPDLPAAGAGEIHVLERGRSLAEIEREAIALTLRFTRGNRSAAARILGISRPTLLRKLRRYGIEAGIAAEERGP